MSGEGTSPCMNSKRQASPEAGDPDMSRAEHPSAQGSDITLSNTNGESMDGAVEHPTADGVLDAMAPYSNGSKALAAKLPPTSTSGITGSRKRKAYNPRNSGLDEPVQPPPPAVKSRPTCRGKTAKSTRARQARAKRQLDEQMRRESAERLQHEAQQLQGTEFMVRMTSFAGKEHCSISDDVLADSEDEERAFKRRRKLPDEAPPLAVSRPRRDVKPRKDFDPAEFDLSGEAGDSLPTSEDNNSGISRPAGRINGRSEAARRRRAATAALADCVAHGPGRPQDASARQNRSSDCKQNWTEEQRMFQAFRKRPCNDYTGVIVHCQNMKLEARINMVSYLPKKERKVSGGQVYIAYMMNPHQAAIVHDITASIITADGISIYFNHKEQPSVNSEVRMDRLNYNPDLTINTHRPASKGGDAGDKPSANKRAKTEPVREGMLSPTQLSAELHRWVAHEQQWMTFKRWIEDYLFEAKLANMALNPKVLDDSYLSAEDRELVLKVMRESAQAVNEGHTLESLGLTQMYDQLTLDRNYDAEGKLTGFTLKKKAYRKRRPQAVKGPSVKWAEAKNDKTVYEEEPTAEDQRRVDIAWGVVQKWLANYKPEKQEAQPKYGAGDASFHVTWRYFADWVNESLVEMPKEVQKLQDELQKPAAAPASHARRSSANPPPNPAVLRAKIEELKGIYSKYRQIVPQGTQCPTDWEHATEAQRTVFGNLFPGWKSHPPSHTLPQRKSITSLPEGPALALDGPPVSQWNTSDAHHPHPNARTERAVSDSGNLMAPGAGAPLSPPARLSSGSLPHLSLLSFPSMGSGSTQLVGANPWPNYHFSGCGMSGHASLDGSLLRPGSSIGQFPPVNVSHSGGFPARLGSMETELGADSGCAGNGTMALDLPSGWLAQIKLQALMQGGHGMMSGGPSMEQLASCIMGARQAQADAKRHEVLLSQIAMAQHACRDNWHEDAMPAYPMHNACMRGQGPGAYYAAKNEVLTSLALSQHLVPSAARDLAPPPPPPAPLSGAHLFGALAQPPNLHEMRARPEAAPQLPPRRSSHSAGSASSSEERLHMAGGHAPPRMSSSSLPVVKPTAAKPPSAPVSSMGGLPEVITERTMSMTGKLRTIAIRGQSHPPRQ